MEEQDTSATVSSDVVNMLIRGVALGQPSLAQLLTTAGVDPALLTGPHRRITAQQFDQLWNEMERMSGDPNFGLHLGEAGRHMSGGNVVFASMMNSATVLQALRRFCRYHDIMADIVRPTLSTRPDGAVVRVEVFEGTFTPHRHHVECIASLMVSFLRRLTDAPFDGRLRFAHAKPADVSEHRRVFGVQVEFCQPDNELILARSFLDGALLAANEELAGHLDEYAERVLARLRSPKPWSRKVADVLGRALCDGKPTLKQVARSLTTTGRSLQNRLREEGTSFQTILDESRRSLAESYLTRSDVTLAEIAFLVGFADQSAFQRAFKKWTGKSPLAFRKARLD
jgi:AraC-like DNA-binding protein